MSILLWLAPTVKEGYNLFLPFGLALVTCIPSSIKKRKWLECSRQKSNCFLCFHCSVLCKISGVSFIAEGVDRDCDNTAAFFLPPCTSELSNKSFEIIAFWRRKLNPYREADATTLYILGVHCAVHGQL